MWSGLGLLFYIFEYYNMHKHKHTYNNGAVLTKYIGRQGKNSFKKIREKLWYNHDNKFISVVNSCNPDTASYLFLCLKNKLWGQITL